MGEAGDIARGADQYRIAWRLTAGAWLGCALLQLILYLRPSPYGGPFLIALEGLHRPAAGLRAARGLADRPALPAAVAVPLPAAAASPRWRIAHWALIALMAANLLVTAFDHELYRFLGLRLGPNFLDVYADPTTLADSLFLNILLADRGGPFLSPILCVAAPGALPLVGDPAGAAADTRSRAGAAAALRGVGGGRHAGAAARHRRGRLFARQGQVPAVAARAGPVRRGPRLRLDLRGRPSARRSGRSSPAPGRPTGWREAATATGASPTASGRSSGCRPTRARRRRTTRWNVLIIQLESVRGVDTGHLRPDREPSPTPYLDALAARPDAAVWTRALSFGPPSINGRFALQCSITPTSRRFITSQTLANLLLPVRRAARAGLSRRDVQRRRHRHGQQHGLGAAHVRPAVALSRGGAARPRDLPPRRGADPGDGAAGAVHRDPDLGEQPPPVPLARAGSSTSSTRARRCGSGSSTPSATPTTSCAS